MIKVYHYSRLTKSEVKLVNGPNGGWDASPRLRRYADITTGFGSSMLPQVAIGLLNGEYQLVAAVDSDDLEDGFRYTNHIDHDWAKSPAHIVTALPGEHRSTSVGDVFTHKGRTYVVAPMGFKLLTSEVE